MISNFRLKFGRAPGLAGEQIEATPVTVFVGPNNSGKSKVLSEIAQYCNSGQKNAADVIVENLELSGVPKDRVGRVIEDLKIPILPSDVIQVGHIMVGGSRSRYQVRLERLKATLENPALDISLFCYGFLTYGTLMLDGRSRIALANPQTMGDLLKPPQSSFQVLFQDDARRKQVRRIVAEAFGSYFVLDPTHAGQLRIRLSARPPLSDLEERGIHKEAVEFHAAAQSIDTMSDGIKAFIGIITELIGGDPRVVLIDEPEAFLHPSLAFKLGYEVSRAAVGSDMRVFASTHSSSFVMGCIQSGAPVNIIRLTYRDGVATARVLPSGELLELMRNPLLRSSGVLEGLFYEFIVVTESDADRAFYREVNERLVHLKPDWGIPNCLFINAQNKQTVRTIIRPLRKLGIPAAGIVDVDVLKEGGSVWTDLLGSAYVPDLQRNSLATLRAEVNREVEATGRDMKRDGGIAVLSATDQEAARNLFRQVAEYGIFVVPCGELESWLKTLGATGHGPSWLIDMFEKMGEDPASPDYLRPSTDDVWHFMSEVKGWLTNSMRKGIPT